MKDVTKGWDRVCLGSVAGAALGAALFFAIEALMPQQASAEAGAGRPPQEEMQALDLLLRC